MNSEDLTNTLALHFSENFSTWNIVKTEHRINITNQSLQFADDLKLKKIEFRQTIQLAEHLQFSFLIFLSIYFLALITIHGIAWKSCVIDCSWSKLQNVGSNKTASQNILRTLFFYKPGLEIRKVGDPN